MAVNLKFIARIVVIGVIVFALYTLVVPNTLNIYNLPENIYNNPELKEAYIFAIENPDILEQIPCFCGCEGIGHESNKKCYYSDDGTLSEHATSCGGCVGTTLDVKIMIEQGRDIDSIKKYIDEKYAPIDNE